MTQPFAPLPSPSPPAPAPEQVHAGLWTDARGATRCAWCRATPGYADYHDHEWGFPETDDRALFEKLCLEGFQSGLSWLTILNKRNNFRQAFDAFDADCVARYGSPEVRRLMANAGIVRHRGKIESTINNAKRMLQMVDEFGSLCGYAWLFEPAARPRATHQEFASRSLLVEAIQLAADLKHRGWTFVGPTTVYAFMQAMGLVNDHLDGCAIAPQADAARAKLG